MAQLFEPVDTNLILDESGRVIPNARVSFFKHGTFELLPIFSDSACTIPLPNPMYADGNGRIVDTFLHDSVVFDVRVHDDCGNLVRTAWKSKTRYANFPYVPCINDVRLYEGPSPYVYTTDDKGRLALYRLVCDGEENYPTTVVGIKGTWVGGVIMTEFDILALLEEANQINQQEEDDNG